MSCLYRTAITITRRQPYLDWANSFDDAVELTEDFANERRTVYLVAESEDQRTLAEIIDEYWEQIFEQELAAWMESEGDWPAARTLEMFHQWFEVEVTESVIDLDPDEALTQTDVELAELSDAFQTCAWCELELETSDGRYTGFPLAD